MDTQSSVFAGEAVSSPLPASGQVQTDFFHSMGKATRSGLLKMSVNYTDGLGGICTAEHPPVFQEYLMTVGNTI